MSDKIDRLALLPDTKSGLAFVERVVLHELRIALAEQDGDPVHDIVLYGRVQERIKLSAESFQFTMQRLMDLGVARLEGRSFSEAAPAVADE